MSDSFGGLINIVIVTLFIVIAIGYIAFNINYTKAFRAKDKIIDLFEKYEGDCINNEGNCYQEIVKYADSIGYKPSSLDDYHGYNKVGDLFLYKVVYVGDSRIKDDVYQYDSSYKVYYYIVTKVNVEIPIIRNILPFRFFYVTGSTRIIER